VKKIADSWAVCCFRLISASANICFRLLANDLILEMCGTTQKTKIYYLDFLAYSPVLFFNDLLLGLKILQFVESQRLWWRSFKVVWWPGPGRRGRLFSRAGSRSATTRFSVRSGTRHHHFAMAGMVYLQLDPRG
jgi:hypothetical protein